MAIHRITALLLRWHRRIGLFVAIFIVFLVVTGLLINHTSSLKLTSIKLDSPWLLSWYGIEDTGNTNTPPSGFKINNNQWLYGLPSGELFINKTAVGNCQPPLQSALVFQQMLLALCHDQLLLLDDAGQLLENINTDLGLPSHVTRLGHKDSQLIVQVTAFELPPKALSLDLIQLNTSLVAADNIVWSHPQDIPDNYLTETIERPSISLQTLLLDIHSGRFFGTFGVIVVDIASIGLLLLALSGCWVWINRLTIIKLHRQKNAKKTSYQKR